MSETTKLLPCPFCGNEASIGSDGEYEMFYVVCTNSACFCAVGEGYDRSAMPDHAFGSREAAAQAWNTRAVNHQTGPSGEAEILREALVQIVDAGSDSAHAIAQAALDATSGESS